MKSKFRKLFWLRIGMGFFIFSAMLYYCLDSLFKNKVDLKLFPAFLILAFLIYMSTGLLKIYTLTVSEKEIELQSFLWRDKKIIPLKTISGLEYEKVQYRNSRGSISDGHKMCYLRLNNNERFLISPDTFENYEEIVITIKKKLELALDSTPTP